MKILRRRAGSPVKSCVSLYFCYCRVSAVRPAPVSSPVSLTSLSQSWMDRLRRSFRSSFRRREELQDESGGPVGGGRQWPADEAAVKTNSCSFEVKYLGSVEVISLLSWCSSLLPSTLFQVFESRGMQVCEEALKNLKNSKRRPIKGNLHISGDGLRVSDLETKGLVLDQTIEKVSFCAPDRNYEAGFSYICRDGTSRRWLCHGFLASKESGERLSHAVGCAFAICLEKKQKRDKECVVQMRYDHQQNTFTRFGSFRQGTITERLRDPQTFKAVEPPEAPAEPVSNPNAVARPKPSDLMYLRQASFRGGFGQLSGSSPFKRQFSLRLNELPSTLARQARDCETNNIQHFSPIKEDLETFSPPATTSQDQSSSLLLPTPAPPQPPQPPQPPLPPLPPQSLASSVNPWDHVPDQPLSRRPTSLKTDISLPLDDWLNSQQLSSLTLLQPEKSKPVVLSATKAQSLDSSFGTITSQTINQQQVDIEDPFDAEWVDLAMRKGTRIKASTNPFSEDAIKTFQLNM